MKALASIRGQALAVEGKSSAGFGDKARPRIKKRRREEDAVQKEILSYIEAVVPRKVVFAIPNGAQRTPGGRAANAVPGLLPGVYDICLCLPKGRVIFIESKARRGRPSDAQIDFAAKLNSLSHQSFIARSQEDCRQAFLLLGVETREARR